MMNSSESRKESFKLLAVSDSNSGSDVPEYTAPPNTRRKVKLKKRLRVPNSAISPSRPHSRLCSILSTLRTLGILLLFAISGTALWLGISLQLQLQQLQLDLQQVQVLVHDVPGQLHQIHWQQQDIERNLSSTFADLKQLHLTLETLTSKVDTLQKSTSEIDKKISSVQQIADVGTLEENVANLGSKLTTLESEMNDAGSKTDNAFKSLESQIQKNFTTLTSQLTDINLRIGFELQNHTDKLRILKEHLDNLTLMQPHPSTMTSSNLDSRTWNAINEHISEEVNASIQALIPVAQNNLPTLVTKPSVAEVVAYVNNVTKLCISLIRANEMNKEETVLLTTELEQMNATVFLRQRLIDLISQQMAPVESNISVASKGLTDLRQVVSGMGTDIVRLSANLEAVAENCSCKTVLKTTTSMPIPTSVTTSPTVPAITNTTLLSPVSGQPPPITGQTNITADPGNLNNTTKKPTKPEVAGGSLPGEDGKSQQQIHTE